MSAARYYERAPRYLLRPADHTFMRFAAMDTKGEASSARLRDLSSTGLSFLVPTSGEGLPFAGEMLKVEFGVPGDRQVAWFATVTRVEVQTEWTPDDGDVSRTLIAIQFRKLPPPFLAAIEKSINERVPKNEDSQRLTARSSVSIERTAEFATFAAVSFLIAVLFFWVSLSPAAWFHTLRR